MAVRRPKQPQTPQPTRRPGSVGGVQITNVADVVYNPPSRKRVKTIEQTQTPRIKDLSRGPGYAAVAPPIRAVRNRGSELGRLKAEDTEDLAEALGWAPQIDPSPSSNPPRPRTIQLGYVKERGAPTGTVRIRFRDGTPWDYYDVPPSVWRNLRRVKSPGRFVNRVLNNFDYGRGDW
jgi:KTSC domain-containing protein